MYGLDGAVVSTNDVGRVNNVDLRDGVDVGGEDTIVVAATNRTTGTIDVLALDPDSGALTPLLVKPVGGPPRLPSNPPSPVSRRAGRARRR